MGDPSGGPPGAGDRQPGPGDRQRGSSGAQPGPGGSSPPARAGGSGNPTGEELVVAFARWSAGERVASAARQRSRERWLRQQAAEAATLAGVLTDLAERRAQVILATRSQRLAGQIVGVAEDFCVVEERSGAGVLVAIDHLATVSVISGARPGGTDAAGSRRPPLPLRLADAFSVLAGDRSPVLVTVTNGERVLGQLVGVGTDLITLRALDAGRGNGPRRDGDLSIPLASVEACAPR